MTLTRRSLIASVLCLLALAQTSVGNAEIVAHLESPSSNEIASGIGNIQGWAFTTTPGEAIDPLIEIYIDGKFAIDIPCCSDRGDVLAAHPEAPMGTGFAGAFSFGSLLPGAHTLQAHVYTNKNDVKVLATTFVSTALGSFAFNKKFTWDDAEADHCSPVNTNFGGKDVAQIVCTGVHFTAGNNQTEHCIGSVEFTWMSSQQGFRVTKGCDLIGEN